MAPVLNSLEREIRELYESDTVVENGLVDATTEMQAAYDKIVADKRVDQQDLPEILRILDLVPQVSADAERSRRFNLEVNGRFCRLASQRSQWARARGASGRHDGDDDGGALEMAA